MGVGTESGRIEVWSVPLSVNDSVLSSSLLYAVHANECHFVAVKRLAWRPIVVGNYDDGNESRDDNSLGLTLASCGQDCGVRLFNLRFNS